MPDPRFFAACGPFTLEEVSEIADATLSRPKEGGREIRGVAPLETATPDDIAFYRDRKYVRQFSTSRAGACLVSRSEAKGAPESMVLLFTDDPHFAYARVADAFYPEPEIVPGLAAGACVDPSASVGLGSRIEANAVVGPGAVVGARSLIGAGTVIGPNVVIGDDSRIGSNATLRCCLVGARVRLFSGVRIGEDGFGLTEGPRGPLRVPQLGRVVIEDDVEIGANTTIDRGSGPDTVIGRGSRIDNLVQIGHNVKIGEGCIIVAQAGISGSSVLGDRVVLAGQGGIAGHLKVGDGARIGGQAGVIRDIAEGETVVGFPAMPARKYFRGVAVLHRLADRKSG